MTEIARAKGGGTATQNGGSGGGARSATAAGVGVPGQGNNGGQPANVSNEFGGGGGAGTADTERLRRVRGASDSAATPTVEWNPGALAMQGTVHAHRGPFRTACPQFTVGTRWTVFRPLV